MQNRILRTGTDWYVLKVSYILKEYSKYSDVSHIIGIHCAKVPWVHRSMPYTYTNFLASICSFAQLAANFLNVIWKYIVAHTLKQMC